jgi:hypothetical protein
MIYDAAISQASAEDLKALAAPGVHKETGAHTGDLIKLAAHPSQHVKNYLTAVIAEVSAQRKITYKTEYNGSFTGSYNAIAAKLSAQFNAKKHAEFAAHAKKAADYLVLSQDAAKAIPAPKKGFSEKTGAEMATFKKDCVSKFEALSQTQKSACAAYTGSAFHEWNEKLRAGIIPSGAKPMIQAMANAATEIPEGTILWRGIGVGSSTYHAIAGALIQDGAFQSASYGDHPAFSGYGSWLRLHIGKGVKGLQAAGVFSHFGTSESEIILPPNCRYAVMQVTDDPNYQATGGSKHGKKTIVDILVLPNDDEVAKEAAG